MKEVDVKCKIEALHPYKGVGNRDSYSQYNEGWSDACDALFEALRAAGLIKEWIRYENQIETGERFVCALQHFHSGAYRYCELIKVDEDDVEFRTVDDGSEIAYEWTVTHFIDLKPPE